MEKRRARRQLPEQKQIVSSYNKRYRQSGRRQLWHQTEKGRASIRRRGLKQAFNITPETYAAMLMQQHGRCLICTTTEPGGQHGKHFHVDHDHATGKVRGLLCNHCNLGLGHFDDDLLTLKAAVSYLERHK